MVYSELKRLMLLVALMLLVGGFSSGVVLSQEEAEGGKEPAAVEEAEDNQRAGLRISLTRLAPPPAAEEEVAEAADPDDGEGEAPVGRRQGVRVARNRDVIDARGRRARTAQRVDGCRRGPKKIPVPSYVDECRVPAVRRAVR